MTTTREGTTPVPTAARLPIAALAALFTAGFITTLTETLPAGVLPQMADALSVSESVVGQTITIYALATLLTAIPLHLLTGHWPRRHLLVSALVGFTIANLVTALSVDYTVTMIARFVAGSATAAMWSILGGYAQRLVPQELKGRAMSIAFAGTPVALSVGVPLGAFLGRIVGWQSTYGLITILSALLIGWTLWKLPNIPGQKVEERPSLTHVFRLKGIRTVLIVTLTYILAHTALYTYISPVLAGVGIADQVQWVLLVFGITSIISIWITGTFIDKHHRKLVILSSVFFAVAATVLALSTGSVVVTYVAVVVWGFAFGGTSPLFQGALMAAAREHADAAQPILVVVWHLGIAGGGLIGGILLAGLGTQPLVITVVALTVVAVVTVLCARRHAFPGAASKA